MLSRAPTNTPTGSDHVLHQEANIFVNTMIQGLPATDEQLEEIKRQQEEDVVCNQIKRYCQEGWPTK